jgi:glycosyltransferase involved in cell wall biosynthesis
LVLKYLEPTLSTETRTGGKMKLGMGLITRNEEMDLPECLNTFLPVVDYVVIVDTGSTDNTVGVAKNILDASGKKYELFSYTDSSDSEGRLCNFSAARNQYIKRLEATDCDYYMSVDADDTLTTPGIRGMIKKNPADFYAIKYRMNPGFFFQSYKIWRAGLGVRYVGRVHECLSIDWSKKIHNSDIEFLHRYTENPLQENGTQRNLRILKQEIYPPLRTLFYYANENVDAKNYPEAIKWYLEYIRRSKAGENCWNVELAHCYFRAARWLQALGHTEQAISLSKELLTIDPSWSESWCELAYIAKLQGDFKSMRTYCLKALENKYEPRLFSEADKYTTAPIGMMATVPNEVPA